VDAEPESIMAHSNCDLPCAFGVTPGVTDRQSAEDTYHRLAIKPASFLTALQSSFTLRVTDAAAASEAQSAPDGQAGSEEGLALALVLFQQPQGGSVRAVRLFEMSPALQLWRLGDLMAQAETPDRVFASCDAAAPNLLLIFGGDTIAEVIPGGRLSPYSEVSRIAVTADLDVTLRAMQASFACSVESSWRGSAAYWVYQEQAGETE
ncbi:MAG: hypothetical protein JNL42_05180, partial [Anaerolineae bacterium]|nr:hypothetical protein [Anaerolineae bacterium]